jgi:hypothetical protein
MAEAVVPPDDVLQDLVVPLVVRRVDDPLLLPRTPRMRAGRGEQDAVVVCELSQLASAFGDTRRRFRERLAAARPHLDLGRDQLADKVLVELSAPGRRLQLLEAVRERERLRIEDRELFLDGQGEIGAGVELLAREAQLVLRAEPLLVAH